MQQRPGAHSRHRHGTHGMGGFCGQISDPTHGAQATHIILPNHTSAGSHMAQQGHEEGEEGQLMGYANHDAFILPSLYYDGGDWPGWAWLAHSLGVTVAAMVSKVSGSSCTGKEACQ